MPAFAFRRTVSAQVACAFLAGAGWGSTPLVTFPGLLGASIRAAATDPAGNVYVTGSVDNNQLRTTSGAFQPASNKGASDAFAAKLSPDGTSRVYATLVGGTGSDLAS